ncbi:uncharacterized protein LOC122845184 isoform X2 [Gambusia affinis]|uniref:uncharacterized protein LOC122845184 isoform X2 n=1 Tax=Gambusia affinis TaxID=33528 RepID=UPI001CDBF1B8|nr:uncharacterized protein LOC122845184 isoform X2 [Gambusia affinis]
MDYRLLKGSGLWGGSARSASLCLQQRIQDEFHRITMVHLESKFMSKLDEYTPRLLNLFHSKGGSMGLRLQAILLKTPNNPDINMTRDVIIRCLMLYLGESTDQLLKEYDDADEDSVSQDLAVQSLKIYNIKANTSEDPDISIVVDGVKILTALGNFPRTCSLLVGLANAVNLAYPKELRYTFEVFQKLSHILSCFPLVSFMCILVLCSACLLNIKGTLM